MEGLLGLEALGPWGTKVSEEGGVVHYHPISPFTSLPLPSPCSARRPPIPLSGPGSAPLPSVCGGVLPGCGAGSGQQTGNPVGGIPFGF